MEFKLCSQWRFQTKLRLSLFFPLHFFARWLLFEVFLSNKQTWIKQTFDLKPIFCFLLIIEQFLQIHSNLGTIFVNDRIHQCNQSIVWRSFRCLLQFKTAHKGLLQHCQCLSLKEVILLFVFEIYSKVLFDLLLKPLIWLSILAWFVWFQYDHQS